MSGGKMSALITALEIERLTREREAAQVALDEAKREKVKLRRDLRKEQEATLFLTRRLEAAERKVEKLREALEPFARCVTKDGLRSVVYPDHANTFDFLNARAALAETEKGDE